MSDARLVIGTGGIFTSNPYALQILAGGAQETGRRQVLRPTDARTLLDKAYVLFAAGLLVESHPETAFALFSQHFGLEDGSVAAWVCEATDAMTGRHPENCGCGA
jgi:hypothetical protein